MSFSIYRKSRFVFGWGVMGNTCIGDDQSKQYRIGYFGENVAATANCITPSFTQTINSGVTNTQTGNWGGVGLHIWQQKDWQTKSSQLFDGGLGLVTVGNYGCHFKCYCSGGYTQIDEYIIPRMDISIVSQTSSTCVVRVQWVGDQYLTTTSIQRIFNDTGLNNTWVQVGADYSMPANTQTGAILDYPYVDITLSTTDSKVPKHFKGSIFWNDGTTDRETYADIWFELIFATDQEPVALPSANSFLSMNADGNGCNDECVCLPIMSLDDFKSQYYIDAAQYGWDENDLLAMLNSSSPPTLFYLDICSSCNSNDLTHTTADIESLPSYISWQLQAGTTILVGTVNWYNFIVNPIFSALTNQQQFRFCLVRRIDDGGGEWHDDLVGCSDFCFVKSDDVCNTSLITYSNNEDAFGFIYAGITPAFSNTARLPLRLEMPQPITKKTGYQKSDGTFQKLSARINKQWELATGFLNEPMHDKLQIALEHDTIHIQNNFANVDDDFYCDEPYKINWVKEGPYIMPTAKASTKIYKVLNPKTVNSNC